MWNLEYLPYELTRNIVFWANCSCVLYYFDSTNIHSGTSCCRSILVVILFVWTNYGIIPLGSESIWRTVSRNQHVGGGWAQCSEVLLNWVSRSHTIACIATCFYFPICHLYYISVMWVDADDCFNLENHRVHSSLIFVETSLSYNYLCCLVLETWVGQW